MLFAAEGGGFFCSSASGYSQGLAILLLGQEDNHPPLTLRDHSIWRRQYNLTHHRSHPHPHPHLQLASRKDWLIRKCASFVCFGGCGAAGLESSSSPLKVLPPTQQQQQQEHNDELFDNKEEEEKEADTSRQILKSSLKKLSTTISFYSNKLQDDDDDIHISHQTECKKRKVQWTDTCGGELAEIQEFELSESGGSDGEFDNGNEQRCLCRLM